MPTSPSPSCPNGTTMCDGDGAVLGTAGAGIVYAFENGIKES